MNEKNIYGYSANSAKKKKKKKKLNKKKRKKKIKKIIKLIKIIFLYYIYFNKFNQLYLFNKFGHDKYFTSYHQGDYFYLDISFEKMLKTCSHELAHYFQLVKHEKTSCESDLKLGNGKYDEELAKEQKE